MSLRLICLGICAIYITLYAISISDLLPRHDIITKFTLQSTLHYSTLKGAWEHGEWKQEGKRVRERQREAASGSVGGSTFHEFARWPFRLQIFVVVFRLLFPSFCLGARCCPCPVPTPRVEWQSARSTRNSENETRRQTDRLSERVTTTGRIRNVALQLLALALAPSSSSSPSPPRPTLDHPIASIDRSIDRFMASPKITRCIICENMLISRVLFFFYYFRVFFLALGSFFHWVRK